MHVCFPPPQVEDSDLDRPWRSRSSTLDSADPRFARVGLESGCSASNTGTAVIKLLVLFNDCLVVLTLVRAPNMEEIQNAFTNSGSKTPRAIAKLLQLSKEMGFLLESVFGLSMLSVREREMLSNSRSRFEGLRRT